MAIGIQKLSAGSGYEYLTRQVAAMDATGRGHGTLSDYYSARGESPGHWYGDGLASVGLAPGDPVTREQIKLLFGAGNLSDRIGAKRALAIGIAIFTITSAACALAPSTAALVTARCAQGAGAAIMLPASMALVREAFPDPGRRARALGIWAVGGAVAGLVGQPLGGLLTTYDWRWVFTINLPVGAAMLIFLVWVSTSPRRPQPFDWVGQVLAVVGLAALVYGLIDGGHAGFGSGPVVLALAVAVMSLAGFVVVQSRVRHPMMPLDLFHAHGFRIALPVGFAFMVGSFDNVFVIALYLQQHLGLSPLRAGLVFRRRRSSPSPATCPAAWSPTASGPVSRSSLVCCRWWSGSPRC